MKKMSVDLQSWIIQAKSINKHSKADIPSGRVIVFDKHDAVKIKRLINKEALPWQASMLNKQQRELYFFMGKKGPVWILTPFSKKNEILSDSLYAWNRDTLGSLVSHFKAHSLKTVQIEFITNDSESILGALVGLDLAAYNYKDSANKKYNLGLPQLHFSEVDKNYIKNAANIAFAVNSARHLVNMPPNELNPLTFVEIVKNQMNWSKDIKINIWDEKKLKKENMGLLLAVGEGAKVFPRLLHISYRPKFKNKLKAWAFVGKGITFDSGGLDLKPSANMRLMKKDMGGAASVLGLAQWVSNSKIARPCDFYLALAENAVSEKSFRPSDIYTSKSGIKVEIDNTDAEGRLVLADALTVALDQDKNNSPELVIDLATLTGACRVALGVDIAGLFSNDDDLAFKLQKSGTKSGDLNWRLPLFEKYFSAYSSPFADIKNAGESFGGAITAALFLQKFVKNTKWAHLDMYCWTDKATGAFSASGGTGQGVQCLIDLLKESI